MGLRIEKRIHYFAVKSGVLFAVFMIYGFGVAAAHEGCNGHSPLDHEDHDHHHDGEEEHHQRGEMMRRKKLPEELAEEEDLKLYGFGGGRHSHSHDHSLDPAHHRVHSEQEHFQSHSHSLKDLSVGLSILDGIILFLLVEKLVRYVEDSSGGVDVLSHGHHHHHHHKKSNKLKAENDAHENLQGLSKNEKDENTTVTSSQEKMVDGGFADSLPGEKQTENAVLHKALMLGQKLGQSSLIEGFTAGGFIYIAVAGVLAE